MFNGFLCVYEVSNMSVNLALLTRATKFDVCSSVPPIVQLSSTCLKLGPRTQRSKNPKVDSGQRGYKIPSFPSSVLGPPPSAWKMSTKLTLCSLQIRPFLSRTAPWDFVHKHPKQDWRPRTAWVRSKLYWKQAWLCAEGLDTAPGLVKRFSDTL